MQYYYSVKEKGFFNSFINMVIPEDAVEITEELYQQLLDGQTAGKIITTDQNGQPILTDPPPLTGEQIKQQTLTQRDSLLAMASEKIAPLQDAVDLDMATDEEVASLKEWKKYRVQLNRVEQQSGFPNQIEWPEMPSY